jgi:hypothetical protein
MSNFNTKIVGGNDQTVPRKHYQPNGRPIHPECRHVDWHDANCNCSYHWYGWDGTVEGAEKLAKIFDRLDDRRCADGKEVPKGAGPDSDEPRDPTEEAGKVTPTAASDFGGAALTASEMLDDDPLEGGYWREGNRLRLAAGIPMTTFNPERMRGGTWARAAAASNPNPAPTTCEQDRKETERLQRLAEQDAWLKANKGGK